jgi:hypothetical protein
MLEPFAGRAKRKPRRYAAVNAMLQARIAARGDSSQGILSLRHARLAAFAGL